MLMSVLEFISASGGSLSLKDIEELLKETRSSYSSCDEDIIYFSPFLFEYDGVELISEQLKALVLVSGYCSGRGLLSNTCDDCRGESFR